MDYVARTPAQLGPILKSLRGSHGLTQQDAGAKVGLKQSTVSALERLPENSSVETLYKLLSALGLELIIRDKSDVRHRSNQKEW